MSTRQPIRQEPRRQEELEERLLAYQEEAYKKVEQKLDTLLALFQTHVSSEGHELLSQRVQAIEDTLNKHEEQPLRIWQVIAGIVGLLFTLGFLFMSFISTTISIILFVRSFH